MPARRVGPGFLNNPQHAAMLALLAGTLLTASSTGAAAQPRNKQAAVTQSSQVYGYTDPLGVTCLTNLAPDPRDNPGYKIVVEGELASAGQSAMQKNVPASPELHRWVEDAARQEHVDGALIYAVMAIESGFNANAVSNKGAAGLMQLMPTTASQYGVANRFDGQSSVRAGAHYLHDLLAIFGNNLSLAVAAYNSGENAVHYYHDRIPPYAETQNYVPRVLALYHQLGGAAKTQ